MFTHGSLFSGVGGCDLGFEDAGFETVFQVEWDKHCQQVLGHHWPDVPRWSDVSDVSGAELPVADVISYGFPCQDLSIAGKRAGLDGDRSGLFFEAVRIIKEMREASDGQFPRWAVAENVAGLLTADGGDAMARCIDALAEAGALVIEWCVLDAQWFGVPQRRRRVFLAACFDSATADRCGQQIFPVCASGSRDIKAILRKREGTAGIVAGGVGENGSAASFVKVIRSVARDADGNLPPEVWRDENVAPTLTQFDMGDARATTVITFTAQRVGEAPRIYKDSSPALLSRMGTGGNTVPLVAQPVAFGHTQGLDIQPSTDVFPTLRVGGGGAAFACDLAVRRLTPVECERLMGWPDDHTLHRADGKLTSDSQRYRMCGNGIVAPVAAWVAKQLRSTLER
jgi:DNA (cytosine-5)-methyltransferase 1